MDENFRYQEENAAVIDRWVEEGWEWGVPISHEEYERALRGDWQVLLTPTKAVPREWFGGELRERKILGLASGGGQQMPIFCAAGAVCTVLDYSRKQLDREREVAGREDYTISVIRWDMTRSLPFPDESYDIIFNPVSNCYVRELDGIWRECFRVLRKGGRLLVGFDNGFNYLFGEDEERVTGRLPFDPIVNEDQRLELARDDGGWQFSHTISEEIGGQLRAGFRLLDIYEDTNSAGPLRERGVPTFYATLAVKE